MLLLGQSVCNPLYQTHHLWRDSLMNFFFNEHLFLTLLWLCLLTFVCFPQEPPYFTAEPPNVILAEVEKDVDILCQAMGECKTVPAWTDGICMSCFHLI